MIANNARKNLLAKADIYVFANHKLTFVKTAKSLSVAHSKWKKANEVIDLMTMVDIYFALSISLCNKCCAFMICFIFRLRPPNRIVSTTPFFSLHLSTFLLGSQVVGTKAEHSISCSGPRG